MVDITILVACHEESQVRALKPPFVEVCVDFMPTKPFGYQDYLSKESSFLRNPEVWSEVAVFLNLLDFSRNSTFVGLQHYRRFFLLDETSKYDLVSTPMWKRNEIVESGISKLNLNPKDVIVPSKWKMDNNAWDQFVNNHPMLENLLTQGTHELDLLLKPIFGEIDSQAILKDSYFLFPYNMFIGHSDFYSEWKSILCPIIEKMEVLADDSKETNGNRWGGYLVERLFSVFVTLSQSQQRWNIIEKSVLHFDSSEYQITLDGLNNQVNELKLELSSIQTSRSWKLTTPLRSMVNRFRIARDHIKSFPIFKRCYTSQIDSILCLRFDGNLFRNARRARPFSHSIETLEFAISKAKEDGVALEFGVYSGRTLQIIATHFPNKVIGFDSFEGLPEDWRAGFSKGSFLLKEIPKIDGAEIIPGLFQETLETFLEKTNSPISFIHLDADLYSSTKYVLNKLNTYIKPGCIIVFDEFMNYPGFENHEYLAFKEWVLEYSRSFRVICYTSTHEQMGFMVTK